ncbi:hypothetical protein VOLCADRAFT_107616 [Volvox carteri f. nagariensis]|uniref:Uncharacterized protein n=1 Tax=Volvox carteri f. nagariensis TaxID=3068 RepID=D8UF55_VOLCA|nr:uncharacterized protein VOLCADRAFT_107616 [Volvox carteri f. nagariensis]EFJ41622.1 hypothetical protein VOLCADRAFT_107616 [Volvox carteri f. nagariensis]|eukprot:XP_002957278.1 hypothetical protein VOLCADRAFT_107616 [Volvox carteri f. nagariensis]
MDRNKVVGLYMRSSYFVAGYYLFVGYFVAGVIRGHCAIGIVSISNAVLDDRLAAHEARQTIPRGVQHLLGSRVIKVGILWTDISEGLAPWNDTPATTPIHIKTIICRRGSADPRIGIQYYPDPFVTPW